MFGQNQNKGFGFGNTTSTFGQNNTFGQPQTSVFGQTSTFGSATTQQSGGLFGTAQPAQNNLFGTNTTTAFGQNQQQTQGFGGFGGTATSQPSLFGQTSQPSNAFGNTSFGGQPAGPAFNFGTTSTAATGGGLFGQQQPAASGGLFGAPTATAGGGLFGASTSAFGGPAAVGTTVKFKAMTGTDTMMKNGEQQTINIQHQCITCMKEYETKSLEELRMEDYTAGRKSAPAAATSMFGAGGQTATPSLFGNTPASTANTGFSFGQPQQQNKPLFGGTGAFGQTNTQTPAFGTPTSTATPFGAPAASTGNVFGMTAPSTASTGFGFGQQQPAKTGFGFGNTPATTQTTTATTPFGAAKPFGATSFGSTGFATNLSTNTSQAKPFGATSFGSPATNTFGGGFGTQPASSAGAFSFTNTSTAATTNMFSKPNTTPFGGTSSFSFANPTNTFGATNNQVRPFGAGAFGTTPTTNSFNAPSLFGGAATGTFGTSGSNATNNLQTNFNSATPDAATMSRIQQLVMMTSSPHGDNSLFRGEVKKDQLRPTSIVSQKAVLSQLPIKPCNPPTDKLKVKPVNGNISKSSLFSGLDDTECTVYNSPKRFTIKPKSPPANDLGVSIFVGAPAPGPETTILDDTHSQPAAGPLQSTPFHPNVKPVRSPFDNSLDKIREEDTTLDFGKNRSNSSLAAQPDPSNKENENKVGVKLNREGYYTKPPLCTLEKDSDGHCFVEDFVIGRKSYGSAKFLGKLDIADMNLDEIVVFSRREISVYPDEATKPPLGQGLNRKAEVTLEEVYPVDKEKREAVTSPQEIINMKFRERLERHTLKLGATFTDYDTNGGKWSFRVNHFSKYGLDDDDDEEDMITTDARPLPPANATILAPGAPQMMPPVIKPLNMSNIHRPQPLNFEEEASYLAHNQVDDCGNKNYDQFHAFSSVSYQMCQEYNIEANKLQGMKASLFGMDDMMDTPEEEMFQPSKENIEFMNHYGTPSKKWLEVEEKRLKLSPVGERVPREPLGNMKPKRLLSATVTKPKTDFLSNFTKIPCVVEEEDPLDVTKAVHSAAKFSLSTVEKSISIYQNLGNMIVNDMASFNRRKFRPCFSHDWIVSRRASASTQALQSMFPTTFGMNRAGVISSSTVSREVIDFGSETSHLVEMLGLQLKNSEVKYFERDLPQFIPNSGVGPLQEHVLHMEQMQNNRTALENDLYNILSLCSALWGDCVPAGLDNFDYEFARKRALSEWITKVTADVIADEVDQCDGHLEQIMKLLGGHQIGAACQKAVQSKDYNLALLVAQAGHNTLVKQMTQKMCLEYIQSGKDQRIDPERLKIYLLLAGVGKCTTSDERELNVCEGMDWLRCFALHLWYLCSSTLTISQVLEDYEAAVEDNCATGPEVRHGDDTGDGENPLHVCFQLIKLFADRTQSLEKLLTPDTILSVPSQLEYRICWLLAVILQSIGYQVHCIELMHHNLACQLEAMGLWQWAVFPLMHFKDAQRRNKAVYDLICRHVSPNTALTVEESFIQSSLNVPRKLILKAKAMRAGYEGFHINQARLLSQAEHWSEAHQVIMDHLAVKAIINEKYQFLSELLQPLHENHTRIPQWSSRGKVFRNYLLLCKLLDDVLKHRNDEEKALSLMHAPNVEATLSFLAQHIGGLMRETTDERLCQIEMAKKTFTAYKQFLMMKFEKDATLQNCSMNTIFNLLRDLPLPADTMSTEYKNLLRTYPKYLPENIPTM